MLSFIINLDSRFKEKQSKFECAVFEEKTISEIQHSYSSVLSTGHISCKYLEVKKSSEKKW